jgi:DNA-binding NarL/FixJ family response regulator
VKRILIVDDSPAIRRTLRAVFEQKRGWAICGEAENGREALDKAQQLNPDLVVIDLSMPVLNGLEASRTLKKILPEIRLVMFTTFADHNLSAAAQAVGIDVVVDKSHGPTALLAIVEGLLANEGSSSQA